MARRKMLFTSIGCIVRLVIAVLIGTGLMIAVYLIPVAPIDSHVSNSATVFSEEGSYPSFTNSILKYSNSCRDNFTDAWMLLAAAYHDETSPLAASMANNINRIEGKDPVETIIEHYQNGKDFNMKFLYGRYWNGYLVFLKPLLYFFNYTTIRFINIGLQLILLLIILLLLKKRNMSAYIAPYLLSVFMIMPLAIVLCIQLSNCYTLFNLGIILILLFYNRLDSKAFLVFLWMGIATAFVDLLSYPLVTFGVPAVFYFCIKNQESIKKAFFNLMKFGIAWCFGYGGMWISKWIIGSVLSGENLFLDGFNQVLFRAGTASDKTEFARKFSVFSTISSNIQYFLYTFVSIFVVIYIIVMIIQIIKNYRKNSITLNEVFTVSFPFILLMIAPLVWYAVIRNHSAIHAFTLANKELIITSMAVTCLCMKLNKQLKNNRTEK